MGKRAFRGLLDVVLGMGTVVFSTVLSFSFLARFIHPANGVFFQWLALALSVLLIINLSLLLFWLIRRRRWYWFPVIALIANFWYYPSVLGLRIFDTEKNVAEHDIVLATYNISSLKNDGMSALSEIRELLNEKHIDILSLQEFPLSLSEDSLSRLFPSLPYIAIAGLPDDFSGVAVLSKFPIIRSNVISFEERPNSALFLNLKIHGKDVLLVNCHLQTTNWNQRMRIAINDRILNNSPSPIVKQKEVMDNNFVLRANQADSISRIINSISCPTIVCGDLNDSPASYVYHRIKGNLSDSYRTSGRGYAYTYKYLGRLLRIDYLFYSSYAFKAKSYESPILDYSDHNPIIVTLGLK